MCANNILPLLSTKSVLRFKLYNFFEVPNSRTKNSGIWDSIKSNFCVVNVITGIEISLKLLSISVWNLKHE